MSFLNLEGKKFLITGVANKKSVAYFTAKTLIDNGAQCFFTVLTEEIREKVIKLFPDSQVTVLDVEKKESLENLSQFVEKNHLIFDGFLHSLAFANYSEGMKPFHETKREDFLQASQISCFSLVEIANLLKPFLHPQASVVTISISSTRATNYGYMGPIKAALDATVLYLAKSFSQSSQVRFNAVCSGPLKTSASAGIPGYIDNYLYAEALTMRHQALETQEVANSVVFLLSPASSGINASGLLIDAGMSANYFDEVVVDAYANREGN